MVVMINCVLMFGESCLNLFRCLSDVLLVTVLTWEHVDGVVFFSDIRFVFVFCKVVSEFGCWFVCDVNVERG